MSLAPRAVIVHRPSELDALVARHGTRGQVEFFLRSRGRTLADVQARHDALAAARRTVAGAIPDGWRRGAVARDDLPRFLFDPTDIVIAVGQDGLVANLAKYLIGQPVIGVDPEPGRNPGILVTRLPESVADILPAVADRTAPATLRAMVTARCDDGQELTALNEVYLGHPTHQSARYTLSTPDGAAERQASSGLIAGTGTGSTGWCRSAWQERHSRLRLPAPTDPLVAWFVREAWPSPDTGTDHTEGHATREGPLAVTVESDALVVFGDGLETDRLTATWGQTISIAPAERTLTHVT